MLGKILLLSAALKSRDERIQAIETADTVATIPSSVEIGRL
jgi:hypothetical protein